MSVARKLGRFVVGLITFAACFVIAFLGMAIAARELSTIWLPVTLCAIFAALLALAKPSTSRPLLWIAVSFGVVILWFLSEPQVSIGSHPRWMRILVALVIGCGISALALFGNWIVKRSSVFGWAVALVAMSWLVAYFSSPSGGSGGMIAAAIDYLGLSASQAELLVLVLRKCIHFCFYGLLGWTAFRWALATGADVARAVPFALLLALTFAAFDEGRQVFFVDRSGSAWDVLLDVAGVGVFVWMSARRVLVRAEQR